MPNLARAIVNQPAKTIVRPLLISTGLHAGENVTVIAGDLPPTPPHDAMFILEGPNSRAQRLVQVTHGIAAGIVTIPRSLRPGTWTLAVEDLSHLDLPGTGLPVGTAFLDLAVFQSPG